MGDSIPAISSFSFPAAYDYRDMDLGELDLYSSQFTDSIFNTAGMYPLNPTFGGGGFGMNEDWQKKYQEQMMNYYKFNNEMALNNAKMNNQLQIETARMERETNAQKTALSAPLNQALANLMSKIEDDEQTQIVDAYNKCLKVVEAEHKDSHFSKDSLKAIVNDSFAYLYKKSVEEAIKENSKAPATQGFFNGLTAGFFCRGSAEKNISEIYDTPIGNEASRDKVVATTVGCSALTLGSWWILKKATEAKVSSLKGFGKFALIVGLGTFLFNKIRQSNDNS